MNTLIFLAGCGIGTTVSGLIFIMFLKQATRGSGTENKKQDELTAKLLSDRNATSVKMEQSLSTIAEWCAENWHISKNS